MKNMSWVCVVQPQVVVLQTMPELLGHNHGFVRYFNEA